MVYECKLSWEISSSMVEIGNRRWVLQYQNLPTCRWRSLVVASCRTDQVLAAGISSKVWLTADHGDESGTR
jgi:hypothetical protein